MGCGKTRARRKWEGPSALTCPLPEQGNAPRRHRRGRRRQARATPLPSGSGLALRLALDGNAQVEFIDVPAGPDGRRARGLENSSRIAVDVRRSPDRSTLEDLVRQQAHHAAEPHVGGRARGDAVSKRAPVGSRTTLRCGNALLHSPLMFRNASRARVDARETCFSDVGTGAWNALRDGHPWRASARPGLLGHFSDRHASRWPGAQSRFRDRVWRTFREAPKGRHDLRWPGLRRSFVCMEPPRSALVVFDGGARGARRAPANGCTLAPRADGATESAAAVFGSPIDLSWIPSLPTARLTQGTASDDEIVIDAPFERSHARGGDDAVQVDAPGGFLRRARPRKRSCSPGRASPRRRTRPGSRASMAGYVFRRAT